MKLSQSEINIPSNEIERFKIDTYNRYKQADGILDICLGLFLVIFWLGFQVQFVVFYFAFIPLFPLLVFTLKKKIVYPRIGRVVFKKYIKQNLFVQYGLYILLFGLGLVFSAMFYKYERLHGVTHPLLSPYLLFTTGLLIIGALTQKHMLYVLALCLGYSVISSMIPEAMWLGMDIDIIFNGTVLTIVIWLLGYKNPIIDKRTALRPNLLVHAGFLLVGLGGMLFVCLTVYLPGTAVVIRQWVIHNTAIVYSSIIAIVLFGIGIAFKAIRLYLYGGLVCLAILLTDLSLIKTMVIRDMLALIGLFIFVIGIWLLASFIKNNPILSEESFEPEI